VGAAASSAKTANASSVVADGLFLTNPITLLLPQILKIDQSMSIVAETDQILVRGNFRLKLRARISDGSPRRFFVMRGKNLRC
jgi:hypothetical protein